MSVPVVRRVLRGAVKPVLSLSYEEANRRAINLYRAWYKYLPTMLERYYLDITLAQARAKLREEFLKNAHVKDPRIVDMLVIKGNMELQETVEFWKQRTHVMRFFKDTQQPRSSDFITRFYEGHL